MELAIVASALLLLVFGIVDFGRAYQLQNRLSNAAREGAAFAQFNPKNVSCSSDDDIIDRVTREDPDLPSDPNFAVTVNKRTGVSPETWSSNITGCGTSGVVIDPGDVVRVQVRATFSGVGPLTDAFLSDDVITRSATVVYQG